MAARPDLAQEILVEEARVNDLERQCEDSRRRAQLAYERDVEAAREARRKSFERAQKAGLSLRDIGDAVGLHRSRVGEILRGE